MTTSKFKYPFFYRITADGKIDPTLREVRLLMAYTALRQMSLVEVMPSTSSAKAAFDSALEFILDELKPIVIGIHGISENPECVDGDIYELAGAICQGHFD